MNRITNKTVSVTGAGSTAGSGLMGTLVNALARSGILKKTSIITCFVQRW
jgi:hypothetical protein